MRKNIKWFVLGAAAIYFLFVIANAAGIFHSDPYYEVPHGNHSHYVPIDRDKRVSIGQFPMRPPGPNERITPTGQIVQVDPDPAELNQNEASQEVSGQGASDQVELDETGRDEE